MPRDMDKARASRSEKRELLKALATGQVGAAELLRASHVALERCDVWELLLVMPKLGRKGAKRVCLESGVFPHKRLGELSETERELLLAALPKRTLEAANGSAADEELPHAPHQAQLQTGEPQSG